MTAMQSPKPYHQGIIFCEACRDLYRTMWVSRITSHSYWSICTKWYTAAETSMDMLHDLAKREVIMPVNVPIDWVNGPVATPVLLYTSEDVRKYSILVLHGVDADFWDSPSAKSKSTTKFLAQYVPNEASLTAPLRQLLMSCVGNPKVWSDRGICINVLWPQQAALIASWLLKGRLGSMSPARGKKNAWDWEKVHADREKNGRPSCL